jgi:hypothetical protein
MNIIIEESNPLSIRSPKLHTLFYVNDVGSGSDQPNTVRYYDRHGTTKNDEMLRFNPILAFWRTGEICRKIQ